MVYQELLERCQLPGFRDSPLGLRDGILAQMAAEYDRSTRSGRAIQSERWESIKRAVEHYRIDMEHALQVRESALLLFSALKSVHQLPGEYRDWLSAAAKAAINESWDVNYGAGGVQNGHVVFRRDPSAGGV